MNSRLTAGTNRLCFQETAVILGYLGLAFGLACIIHERAGRVVFAGHGLGGGQFSPQSDGLSLLDLVQMFAG